VTQLLAVLLSFFMIMAQAGQELDEYAVKSAFLYNFFKFIEWPADVSGSANYNLCFVGDDLFGDNLATINGRQISGKTLIVHRHLDDKSLKSCHMVFLSADNAPTYRSTIEAIRGLPIVLVGDGPDFIAHGGVIRLYNDSGRITFEINLDAARNVNLRMSAQLLKLAKEVRGKQ
jgi:hypothetical protein